MFFKTFFVVQTMSFTRRNVTRPSRTNWIKLSANCPVIERDVVDRTYRSMGFPSFGVFFFRHCISSTWFFSFFTPVFLRFCYILFNITTHRRKESCLLSSRASLVQYQRKNERPHEDCVAKCSFFLPVTWRLWALATFLTDLCRSASCFLHPDFIHLALLLLFVMLHFYHYINKLW